MATAKVRYDVDLMVEDMTLHGWRPTDLAKATRVRRGRRAEPLSDMTISRFLRGETQTAPVAKAIAEALGHDVGRYLISSRPSISSDVSPIGDRRHSDDERRSGLRRRANRETAADRRERMLADRRKAERSESSR